MKLKLRFWLAMLDIAEWCHAPQRCYLWLVGKASDATDWGES